MAFRTQKISQMTPKGSDLEATDLIEVSTIESGSYVTRSITGQEIIDAAVGNVDWGDIGGTLSSQTDLNTALSGKVPTTRTLTINGTTQDLSADRTFTISTGITIGTTAITSGTVGRVLFEGTGNVVQESASLTWDSTNDRLTIGTSTGTSKINLPDAGTTSSDGIAFGNGANIFKNASSGISLFSGSGTWQFNSAILVLPTNQATFIRMASGRNLLIDNGTTTFASINGTTGNVLINTTTDAGFRLDVNGTARVSGQFTAASLINVVNSSTTLDRDGVFLRVHGTSGIKLTTWNAGYVDALTVQATTGNVGIGTSSPSYKLHVVGSAGFDNGASGDAITLLNDGFIQSSLIRFRGFSTQFVIQDNSYNTKFAVSTSGSLSYFNTGGNVAIGTTTDAGFRLDVNGTARVTSIMAGTQTSISSGVKVESDTNIRAWNQLQLGQFNSTNLTSSRLQYNVSGSDGYLIANATSHTAAAGTYYAVRFQNNIAPTSGTAVFNLLDITSTINQTGGANGITRGLYIAPTLTSASDFRAIETTNGKVIFGNLPTSSAGLPTGAIWNDAGTLKIV